MKILYIDESGDHNLQSVDPNYPIFVLAGVIIDYENLENITEQIRAFKIKQFGTDKVILHTSEITRKEGAFHDLHHPVKRQEFYTKLNTLMDSMEYRVVACIVDKNRYKKKYENDAIDAYEYGLHILVERFIYQLQREETGFIYAEGRNKIADTQIQLVWDMLCNKGTSYVSGGEIGRKIDGFSIHKKNENIAGLQIVDLVATPLGRHYLQKSPNKDYQIIKKRLLRNKNDKVEGYGVVILPRDNKSGA